MRFFLLIFLLLFTFADADELDDIESIIKTSKSEFKVAKKEQDLKKLAEIAKKLNENHQKIKKLKLKSGSSEAITLRCNGDICKEPRLQIGDKINITFNLFFADSEEYEKTTLIWQLQQNKKVIKNETKDIFEKGGSKKFDYDIEIDESFSNGKYRIAMQHRTASGKQKSDTFFFVKKPLSVQEIVVSTNKEAKKSDAGIYADDKLYIVSGFTLADINQKINIDVKLLDTTKDEILIEGSFVRPKKGKEKKKTPLTFKIPASKLYKNQKLSFEMKLYADGINEIVKTTNINVEDYKLLVKVPISLKSGKIARYSIKVPKIFVKPLSVDIDPSGGILLSHKTKLSGTMEAINKDNEHASISVKVTDANGKTVSNNVNIKLTTKYVKEKSSKQTYTAPVVASSIGAKNGDTRERKDNYGDSIFEKYDGTKWNKYKEISYYKNGKKDFFNIYNDKGEMVLHKKWRKNGSLEEKCEKIGNSEEKCVRY